MSDAAVGPRGVRPPRYREILEGTGLLRGLSATQLDRLAALWSERVYAPGEYLLREGEPDHFVYVLHVNEARA